MIRRYRYRAYPTKTQQASLARLFGCVRFVYNYALDMKTRAYRNGEHTLKFSELSRQLTAMKKTEQYSWLSQVSSVPLQQSLRNLQRAYTHFFDTTRTQKSGHPQFKSRKSTQSATFTRNSNFAIRTISKRKSIVRLSKIGDITFIASRPLPSPPTSVTVIHDTDDRYYVSFVVTVDDKPHPHDTHRPGAAIDLGLIDLISVVNTNGQRSKIAAPKYYRNKQRALARASRALSRTKKGSHNRHKARLKLARIHTSIARTRLDHLHKLALHLVRDNQTVSVESLNIAGMCRTRMAKSIYDASWGLLLRLMDEKSASYECEIIHIDRYTPTTRTCSVCGCLDQAKTLNIRTWLCPHCQAVLDRDWNAAVNILVAAGRAETLNDCGETIRRTLACAGSMKQEPTEQALIELA